MLTVAMNGHFIRYSLLIGPPFGFRTALIICGIDSTRCCNTKASYSCCKFVGSTSTMPVSRSTIPSRIVDIIWSRGRCGCDHVHEGMHEVLAVHNPEAPIIIFHHLFLKSNQNPALVCKYWPVSTCVSMPKVNVCLDCLSWQGPISLLM